MTDQHPLTDRICFNILSNKYDVSGLDWHKYQDEVHFMRAAAYWQLEQVIKVWEQCMEESGTDIQVIRRFEQKLKAMRPTQEDN